MRQACTPNRQVVVGHILAGIDLDAFSIPHSCSIPVVYISGNIIVADGGIGSVEEEDAIGIIGDVVVFDHGIVHTQGPPGVEGEIRRPCGPGAQDKIITAHGNAGVGSSHRTPRHIVGALDLETIDGYIVGQYLEYIAIGTGGGCIDHDQGFPSRNPSQVNRLGDSHRTAKMIRTNPNFNGISRAGCINGILDATMAGLLRDIEHGAHSYARRRGSNQPGAE